MSQRNLTILRQSLASMQANLAELEKPLKRPMAEDYLEVGEYTMAARSYESAESSRLAQIAGIREYMPIQIEKIRLLEASLANQDSETGAFYRELLTMAEDFTFAYSAAQVKFAALREFANTRNAAYFQKYGGQPALEIAGIAGLLPVALIRRDKAEALILAFGQGAIGAYKPPVLTPDVQVHNLPAASSQLPHFERFARATQIEEMPA